MQHWSDYLNAIALGAKLSPILRRAEYFMFRFLRLAGEGERGNRMKAGLIFGQTSRKRVWVTE